MRSAGLEDHAAAVAALLTATHQGLAVRLSFNLVIDVYNFRAISD
jgi:hypothetical protein